MIKKLAFISLLLSLIINQSCDGNGNLDGNCFVPDIAVNETINMTLPQYFHLQNIGEFIYLPTGNKGIFVVHNYDDTYHAIERTCVYQSDNECSQIQLDSLNLQLRCGTYSDSGFVKCCESLYQLDGRLINGPALCNLKEYRLSLQNQTLFISN